jgi:hypothetical protein
MLKSRVNLRMAPSWTKSADLARNRSKFPLETRKSHSFFRKPNDERRTLGYSGAEIPVKPSGVKSRSVKATSCLIRGPSRSVTEPHTVRCRDGAPFVLRCHAGGVNPARQLTRRQVFFYAQRDESAGSQSNCAHERIWKFTLAKPRLNDNAIHTIP